MATAFDKEELLSRLDEIENEYSLFYSIIYPELELERLVAEEVPDDETLVLEVSSLLSGQQEGEELNLQINHQLILADIESRRDKAEEEFSAMQSELLSDYLNDKEEITSSAFKRGMDRSTFFTAQLEKLEEKYLALKSKLNSQLAEKNEELDVEEDKENEKYNLEHNTMLVRHTSERMQMVNELRDKYIEKREEALKYNNELTEKEREFAKANKDSILKQATEDTISQTSMMKEKLQLLGEFFTGCTPAEVVAELVADQTTYKKYLGETGYALLKAHYEELAANP